MLTLGNALIRTKSRRIPFSNDLQRKLSATRAPATWLPAAVVVAATALFWLVS